MYDTQHGDMIKATDFKVWLCIPGPEDAGQT